MESEQRGKQHDTWFWKQSGQLPNHYWNCEAMQAAAATMLKIVGRESMERETSEEGTPA